MVEAEGWGCLFANLNQMRLFKLANLTKLFQRGGIVLAEKNRVYMKNSGVIVYLQASLETLVERLSQDPNEAQRPSFF